MAIYKKMRRSLGNLMNLVWRESGEKQGISENERGVGRNVPNGGTDREMKEVT